LTILGRIVTAARLRAIAVLLLGGVVLLGAAWSRGAEYDEQYTVFLLAGDARPSWPDAVFTAGAVRDRFHGDAGPLEIAADLRRQDVHPPLYFWAVSAWRDVFGDTLFRLRVFSVLCGLGALAAIGLIARRIGAPPALAMLLALGCYGFAYTAVVARGFALAQLLALLGVLAALRGGRTLSASAGLLLGAASFANYLAAFTAIPVLIWLTTRRLRDGVWAVAGFAAFVAADLAFFLAQRNSRPGQFPPFHLGDGLMRLARYAAACIAGGLPLYAPEGLASATSAAIAVLLSGFALLVVERWRHIATPRVRALLASALIATPAGLLLLGFVFDNTPIELRYLAFAVPYAALLLAGALASLARRPAAVGAAVILALQAAAIAGLLWRAETMQPMRDAGREAAQLAGTSTVVLLPRGNDGVGIVGAFIAESPDDLRLLLVDRRTSAAALHGIAPRLAVALLDRDAESHAAIAALLAGFADDPCWRALPGGYTLIVFESTCGDGRWDSSTASR
jgi:hypothetical protein